MLKYLFSVLYKDGTRYDQNGDDISVKNPSKSCFFDVDLPNVEVFTLIGPGKYYSVDLKSGLFQADSPTWFAIHNENDKFTDRQLIYFRRVTRDINIATQAEVDNHVVYYIGWKALNDEGRMIPYTMAIE